LNIFASQPLVSRHHIRSHIQSIFTSNLSVSIENDQALLSRAAFDEDEVKMILPVNVGDYTDFCEFSERHHLVVLVGFQSMTLITTFPL
jgi:hypothetical protein